MSVQIYSVTIRCEYCDEVIRQTGIQRKDAAVSWLRSKMYHLGWKSTSIRRDGKLQTRDYCPSCSYEHGVG